MNAEAEALVELGRALSAHGYRFVTVTPETHQRVLERDGGLGRSLRDIFGWSRPFQRSVLPGAIAKLADRAGILRGGNDLLRASVRFSSLGERLFVHSAYPTEDPDSVFFGPDTYRFCSFVARVLPRCRRLVDVGCGSGAGGISAAALAENLVLSDVNRRALTFARVNATLAGVAAEVTESDVLAGVSGDVDAIIANPPYMKDAERRVYRDGGGAFGEALSLRIAREALQRLGAGGTLVLYTGAPIVDGTDVFRSGIEALCHDAGAALQYEELDPDVFGTELEQPAYRGVERLAAVGVVARLPRAPRAVERIAPRPL